MPEQKIPDGNWFSGIDSISYNLGPGFYQWAQNVTNRGGIIETRQGFAQITGRRGELEIPRGMIVFSPIQIGVNPTIVVAIGSYVYALQFPYTAALDINTRIPNILFPTATRQVQFEVCVQAQQNIDSVVSDITPRFVLIMQDGVTPPAYYYYNGTTREYVSGHTKPTATNTSSPPWNTPIGSYMTWAGDRLWIANQNKVHAGDLLNPLQFEEEKITSSGGFFFLPGNSTGMGVTHDYKSLLVYTDQTTSAFQVGIEDRTLWQSTQDFQRVIFPEIGCVSHRTIVNQYGMTWWMSHNGVVALDSSLQAYQTSRIQIKDHNMSRSKEGVSWANGGGCSGTFENWLFFSVPSGSKYNVHTWVIDQAVQQNLNEIAPPAWCSNWTGIRPEQWVTSTINGVQRCFCLSNDLVPTGHQATLWEAFIGQRMDVPKNGVLADSLRLPKDIGCAVEYRFLGGPPGQYIKFYYAELDLAEIVGTVHLQVYYCGRRTSYKKILDKQITAQVTSTEETLFDPDNLINIYVPQYRTVRSVTDSHDTDDANTGIQTPYLRSIDKEFSLLVTWTGQMAITGVRICIDPWPDYNVGVCEEDETTQRRLTADGVGSLTTDPIEPNNYVWGFTSKYISPLRPRWVEFPAYDSAVGNGVFFVDIPTFEPVPGGYPISTFAPYLSVILNTEAIADTIVYTTDLSNPTLEPLNGTVYTAPIHVTRTDTTIKARGYRDGMLPSAIATGTYQYATVNAPTFTPIAGQYRASEYPKLVTIISTTPGATIRYTLNNTPVTPNSTVYTAPVSVGENKWLRAKAFKLDYIMSDETKGQYTVLPTCDNPTFNPPEGEYPDTDYPKNVTITTSTTGASISYTINDSDMTNGITLVNGHSVSVNSSDVLRAIAKKAGLADSDIILGTYTSVPTQVAEPSLDPDGGEFGGTLIAVTFHCDTPNAIMCYTTGNFIPPDPVRTQQINRVLDGDVIQLTLGHQYVKVLAFRDGMIDSTIHIAEFSHITGGHGPPIPP